MLIKKVIRCAASVRDKISGRLRKCKNNAVGRSKFCLRHKFKKKAVIKRRTTKENLRPIVLKAIKEIHKKYRTKGPETFFTTAFFSGKDVIIPKQVRGMSATRIDRANLFNIKMERHKKGEQPFDSILMYHPRWRIDLRPNYMCGTTVQTFENFKERDKKFNCIIANSKKEFGLYKSRKR